jgi:hypothetical protein
MPSIVKGPYLQWPTQDSITIMWETSSAASSTVSYWETEKQHGVDLVFNSHTIVYERSHPLRNNRLDQQSGIVYIVAGGAGAKPDWFHHKRSWHTAQAQAHFVQVIVAGHRLEVRAIDVEGRLFDTLELDKSKAPR